MKIIFKTFLIATILFFSTKVFSETYVCSHELSRYNRSGEIETLTYKREGNYFVDSINQKREIVFEDIKNLILITVNKHENPWVYVVFINKNTKEFGLNFLDMSEFKKHPPSPLTYGKCVVVN